MMTFLVTQTVCFSIMASILLVMHKPLLRWFGIHYTYAMWSSLPLLLASAWLTSPLSHWLDGARISQLTHYRVLAVDTITTSAPAQQGWLMLTYSLGVVAMLSLLLFHQLYLINIKRQAIRVNLPQYPLPLLQHPNISSPMLMGMLKPTVLVPCDFNQLTDAAKQCVLSHELSHKQRGDLFANLLAWGLLSLFWFNPLAWMSYRRFRDDQELACDDDASRALSTDQRIVYCQTLLTYSQQQKLGMLNTHYGNKNTLKERIMQIKLNPQQGKSTLALLLLTCGLGLGGLLLNQQVVAGSPESAQTSAPQPISRVEPIYPQDAVNAKANGSVILSFDISPAGDVSNIKIVKSSPVGMFDQSAATALSQWRYSQSAQGEKNALVQLDFVLDEANEGNHELERVRVTQ